MKKSWLIVLIVVLCILVERIVSLGTVFDDKLELLSYDLRAKIATDSGPFKGKFKPADKNIVVITVDDFSKKEISKHPELNLGSWPWRRDVWADVVSFLEQGEPKAILFDLVFAELNENSWNDRRFAQELRQNNNVVLATQLNNPYSLMVRAYPPKYLEKEKADLFETNSDYTPTPRPLNVQIYNKKLDDAITYYSFSPVHDLYTSHNTMGVVNKVMDPDSVIRRNQPIFKLVDGNKTYYMPSLAFAGFLKYMGEDGTVVVKNDRIIYKGRTILINKKGETNTSWHGFGKDYNTIPISRILLCDSTNEPNEYCNPEYFKDKIVIIGRSEAGSDIHPSSVNSSYAGPESNATALDNYINDSIPNGENVRKFVKKIPAPIELLLIAGACLLILLLGLFSKNALVGFINSLAIIFLYILFSIWIFSNPSIRLWVPIVVPIYYLVMTSGLVFAYKFQKELSKKASIMNMFGKFVSPKVLANLLKNQDNLELKNTKKRITMLFCDVKDFTTLSEKCDPEQLMDNLNELFNEIVDVVFENNGTVDKFIGDCIMAYWGDPIASEDDAYMAVKTALEIKKKVNELKIVNAREDKIIFDVKIGINTGEALLGLAGSEKIMSYTVMGDTVNTAARLESACSKLGRDILMSDYTYQDVKDKIVALDAGAIKLKGKDKEVEVYEPIGFVGENLGQPIVDEEEVKENV